MHLYEIHMHTSPVSKCARSTVKEMLTYYASMGYRGVFVTNHFIDGNINIDRSLPYEDRIRFYFSDYEEAKRLEKEYGIDVFLGVELWYGGTDFLVFGLDREWFLAHPEIEGMKKSDELRLMRAEGALIIQAHPFREANYIDHIRLFPRCVDGIEVINASRTEFENAMADHLADAYGLIKVAGSDAHSVSRKKLAGIRTETPIESVDDFISRVRRGEFTVFSKALE